MILKTRISHFRNYRTIKNLPPVKAQKADHELLNAEAWRESDWAEHGVGKCFLLFTNIRNKEDILYELGKIVEENRK